MSDDELKQIEARHNDHGQWSPDVQMDRDLHLLLSEVKRLRDLAAKRAEDVASLANEVKRLKALVPLTANERIMRMYSSQQAI